MNSIINRLSQDTPKFFQKARTMGLILTAITAGLMASLIALPAIIVKITGHLAVAYTGEEILRFKKTLDYLLSKNSIAKKIVKTTILLRFFRSFKIQ